MKRVLTIKQEPQLDAGAFVSRYGWEMVTDVWKHMNSSEKEAIDGVASEDYCVLVR